MKKVWNSGGMKLKLKLRLFNATVMSVLWYGSETWKGLKEIENKLRVFASNCLRKIINLLWYEHVTEEEVRRRNGQQSVIQRWKTQRWRYYGHVLRVSEERLPKQVLSWTPEGRRRRGRPKDSWQRTIHREVRSKDLTDEEVQGMARGREEWRRFVADLWAIYGPKRIK